MAIDISEYKRLNILEIMSGDDDGIPGVYLNPENDETVDCSGFTEIIFTVRDKKGRKVITKTYTGGGIIWDTDYAGDGTDGRFKVVLAARDTANLKGTYRYDLQFNDGSNITTPVKAFILIKEDITK